MFLLLEILIFFIIGHLSPKQKWYACRPLVVLLTRSLSSRDFSQSSLDLSHSVSTFSSDQNRTWSGASPPASTMHLDKITSLRTNNSLSLSTFYFSSSLQLSPSGLLTLLGLWGSSTSTAPGILIPSPFPHHPPVFFSPLLNTFNIN